MCCLLVAMLLPAQMLSAFPDLELFRPSGLSLQAFYVRIYLICTAYSRLPETVQTMSSLKPGTFWSIFLWNSISNLVLYFIFTLTDAMELILQWWSWFTVVHLEFHPKAGCHCPPFQLFHNVSYCWLDGCNAATTWAQTYTQKNLNSLLKNSTGVLIILSYLSCWPQNLIQDFL